MSRTEFKPFEFHAIKYSRTAVARARGLSMSTIRYRTDRGMTFDEALSLPPKSGKVAARARAAGLKRETVRSRMKLKGLTLDEALSRPMAPRGANTITQRARAAGMNPSTVHRRMADRGMTLDEALATPINPLRQPKSKRFAQTNSISESRSIPAEADNSARTERDNHTPITSPELTI